MCFLLQIAFNLGPHQSTTVEITRAAKPLPHARHRLNFNTPLCRQVTNRASPRPRRPPSPTPSFETRAEWFVAPPHSLFQRRHDVPSSIVALFNAHRLSPRRPAPITHRRRPLLVSPRVKRRILAGRGGHRVLLSLLALLFFQDVLDHLSTRHHSPTAPTPSLFACVSSSRSSETRPDETIRRPSRPLLSAPIGRLSS